MATTSQLRVFCVQVSQAPFPMTLCDIWGNACVTVEGFDATQPKSAVEEQARLAVCVHLVEQVFKAGRISDNFKEEFCTSPLASVRALDLVQFALECRQWIKGFIPTPKYPSIPCANGWNMSVVKISSTDKSSRFVELFIGYSQWIGFYHPHWCPIITLESFTAFLDQLATLREVL